MKNLAMWKFSDAAARINLCRICCEAERVPGNGGLVRMKVDGHTLTLAHAGLLREFDTHAPMAALVEMMDVPRVPITFRTSFSIELGDLGVDGHSNDLAGPWYLLPGDHVGTLAARKEVTIEVF